MYDKEKKGEIPTSLLGPVMKNLGHNLKPDQLAECIDAVDGDGKFINDGKQSNQFSLFFCYL
jgi:Ca2+-binding EF-hand superfamily protein